MDPSPFLSFCVLKADQVRGPCPKGLGSLLVPCENEDRAQ